MRANIMPLLGSMLVLAFALLLMSSNVAQAFPLVTTNSLGNSLVARSAFAGDLTTSTATLDLSRLFQKRATRVAPKKKKHRLARGILAIVVILPVLFVLALVGCCVFFLLRRRRASRV